MTAFDISLEGDRPGPTLQRYARPGYFGHHAAVSVVSGAGFTWQCTLPRSSCRRLEVRAIAEPLAQSSNSGGATVAAGPRPVVVTLDNKADDTRTVIHVEADNRPGLLTSLATAFRDLDLEVVKAAVDTADEDRRVNNYFYVRDGAGGKVTKPDSIMNVKRTLEVSRLIGPYSTWHPDPTLALVSAGHAIGLNPSWSLVTMSMRVLWCTRSRYFRGGLQQAAAWSVKGEALYCDRQW